MTLERLRDFIRPLSVATMIAVLLLGALIAGALEAMWPGLGIRFTGGVAGWFRAIPGEYYALAGAALGAYTASRGVEKIAAIRNGGAR